MCFRHLRLQLDLLLQPLLTLAVERPVDEEKKFELEDGPPLLWVSIEVKRDYLALQVGFRAAVRKLRTLRDKYYGADWGLAVDGTEWDESDEDVPPEHVC